MVEIANSCARKMRRGALELMLDARREPNGC
jgi:hypothetical protein